MAGGEDAEGRVVLADDVRGSEPRDVGLLQGAGLPVARRQSLISLYSSTHSRQSSAGAGPGYQIKPFATSENVDALVWGVMAPALPGDRESLVMSAGRR